MRIKIEVIGDKNIILPKGYNAYLQAVVYNHLNEKEAKWLHEHGFMHGKRKFKFFVISEVLEKGRYDRAKKVFIYPQSISFIVSSPIDWILEQIAQNIIKSQFVMFGSNRLSVNSISVEKIPPITSDSIKIKTLSPIEVHRTYELENGKQHTDYYTPFDESFQELINTNIQNKWKEFYKEDCPYTLKLMPLFSSNKNERIRFFKGNVIKGWDGFFILNGNPEILRFALSGGIGTKNSMGFGMVEVVE